MLLRALKAFALTCFVDCALTWIESCIFCFTNFASIE